MWRLPATFQEYIIQVTAQHEQVAIESQDEQRHEKPIDVVILSLTKYLTACWHA